MLFNPDYSKQAKEVYFSRKQNEGGHLPFKFNDDTVQTVEINNHLCLLVDKRT